MLSVRSAGGRSNLDSFYGIIFGWIRSPAWLTARTHRQVCQHDVVAGAGMSTSSWGNGRSSWFRCVARDVESVSAVEQQNVQAAWERGLGHKGRSSVHHSGHSGLPRCLCCSAAPTMVPCLPACQGWDCSQLCCCPGSFELQKCFSGNSVSNAIVS